MLGFLEFYWFFFLFCLVPSIVLGVIFQYLVVNQKTRRWAVLLLTALALLAGVFVNYFVLEISVKDEFYPPVLLTITLSALIVSSLRYWLLKRRNYYTMSFFEEIKTIGFAMFLTPAIMLVVFFLMLFCFSWLAHHVF